MPRNFASVVGLLNYFLKELRLKGKLAHAGERAATLNKLLRTAGHGGRVREARIVNRAGRKPWVASTSLAVSLRMKCENKRNCEMELYRLWTVWVCCSR